MFLNMQDSFPVLTESNPGLQAKISSLSGLQGCPCHPCHPMQAAVQISPSHCSWLAHKMRKRQKRPKEKHLVWGEEEEAEDPCKKQWLSNYQLNEVNIFSLFDEFLEMGM